MISSARLKLLRSLQHKKYRDQHGLFLVEGEKMVSELARQMHPQRFKVKEIYATPEWIGRNQKKLPATGNELVEITRAEIQKISSLVSPQPILALVAKPDSTLETEELMHSPVLAFESIRDPGNLGTIIRTADWFGIRHIICTPIRQMCTIQRWCNPPWGPLSG